MGFAQIQLTQGPDITKPTITTTLGTAQDFEFAVLSDGDCTPIDLTRYTLPSEGTGVRFIAAEFQGQVRPSVSLPCQVIDPPASGVIRLSLSPENFRKPGIYLAEVLLQYERVVEHVYRMYVDVQAALSYALSGPLTIAEVRLWARDSYPDDNFLLDEMEFKDAEVAASIRRAVDIWNSTTPVLTHYTFTPSNFPFRSQWLDLTIALLYSIAARSYLRNHLSYQAAGVQVDDKNKYQMYDTMAQRAKEEFTNWAKETKLQLNVQQAWGRSRIGHSGGIRTYGDYFQY